MRRWILLGLATAIPVTAVALYFALFAPNPAPVAAPATGATAAGLPPDHPPIGSAGTTAQGGETPHPQVGSTGRTVRVPDGVRGKWQAVRLQVQAKTGGSSPQILTVSVSREAAVAGSKLTVQVAEFLPALQVKDNEITSASNEPSNPAALVSIREEGKQVFQGWLFAKFPEMQPFEHPKYRITLIEGVPKR